MDVGHVVRFASQKYPFLIEAAPCLDLACRCSIATLTLSELVPPGSSPDERLTFTLRVCLKTWTERDPPPRSLEVESLAGEFLARFPADRIRELGAAFQRAREIEQRLDSLSLSGSRDELVTYSHVLDERGGVREGVDEHSFFFVFEGREFLVEDHYCANPECDCQEVHLEFWERVHELYPQRGITIRQQLMATFTLPGKLREMLPGKLREIRFSQESDSTTKHLLLAWLRRCSGYFRECLRRYEVIKAVGARSFPTPLQSTPPPSVQPPELRIDRPASGSPRQAAEAPSRPRVGRNDPCPCGSGLKFKRCCLRRSAVAD